MKRIIFSGIIIFMFLNLSSQVVKTDVLQDLEKSQTAVQSAVTTATLKSASRLFKDKDDLTSVILVIPKGSVVDILPGPYDTFLHVVFDGNTGYIYSNHAQLNKQPVQDIPSGNQSSVMVQNNGQEKRPVQSQSDARYEYLEKKYGQSLGSKIYEGKIWKGMNSELVRESWGSPNKINRVISGNIVREEWDYKKTRLYFQNSTLAEWGPVK
ncbi:MAG TPA: hypothetical protein DEO60_05355 [Bacteroidales bacterium]|nr:hypothetical protein [Bacteroidales bacterium]HBZ20534.1 hypothetical protein [Bacteroidales bacterium]